MRAVVIYESLTGNTARAAEMIGQNLVGAGVSATVFPTTAVDFQAVADADLVIVATEWREFRDADPVALASAVAHPLVIDGRNCLDPERWTAAGWTYRGLGRHSA